jgi:ribonuclease P protein component
MDFSFPKKKRICRHFDFDAVFQAKVFSADENLAVNGRTREERKSETRLGLAIGRVYGNAPRRNRIKRLIREAFRLEQHRIPTGLDLIVRPRKGSDPTLAMIRQSLCRLAQRIDRQLKQTPKQSET